MHLTGRTASVIACCEPAIERLVIELTRNDENLFGIVVHLRPELCRISPGFEAGQPRLVSSGFINCEEQLFDQAVGAFNRLYRK